MKYYNIVATALFCPLLGEAFTISQQTPPATAVSRVASSSSTQLSAKDYETMDGEGKINLKIDLDSPKVATMDDIEKVKKKIIVTQTFPTGGGTTRFVFPFEPSLIPRTTPSSHSFFSLGKESVLPLLVVGNLSPLRWYSPSSQ